MAGPLIDRLPAVLRAVPYAGSRFPGSAAVAARPDPAAGANCQLYAYAVLHHFGLLAPPLRSGELWADTRSTVRVDRARLLDLMLFNNGPDPYGAHVGVRTDDGRVLHLCAEVGRPAVWSLADLAVRERYRTLVGVKRVTVRRAPPAPGSGVVTGTSSDR
ncbi:hydrolase [Streptomyces tropicalis]|uniref:hydrolase n=1 Tax=Streptomyces tropicalis TaxID=3034234 RepID=UPI003F68B619